MEASVVDEVTIYTDGSSRGNPGPGGYGVVLLSGPHRKELSGGFRRTTNNRMELMGVICGLRALKRACRVTVVSDSKYVVEAIQKNWVETWQRKNWKTSNREPVKNIDLWRELLSLLKGHEVSFRWIQGHAGHRENERCDTLAVAAAERTNLPNDEGFDTPEAFFGT